IRGDELPVVDHELALGREEQEDVVERPAGQLVRADGEPERVLARDGGNPVDVGAGDAEALLGKPPEGLLRVSLPVCEMARPAAGRVEGNEGLGEERELRATLRSLGGERRELVNRR